MNWEGFRRKRFLAMHLILSMVLPGETVEAINRMVCLRVWNPGHPEHKAECRPLRHGYQGEVSALSCNCQRAQLGSAEHEVT
jgi:hypothetical protein